MQADSTKSKTIKLETTDEEYLQAIDKLKKKKPSDHEFLVKALKKAQANKIPVKVSRYTRNDGNTAYEVQITGYIPHPDPTKVNGTTVNNRFVWIILPNGDVVTEEFEEKKAN